MYTTTRELLSKEQLSYQEILNIRKRLNGFTKSNDSSNLGAEDLMADKEYLLTPEHTKKGLDWLYNIAFKPSHLQKVLETRNVLDEDERANNPLGLREMNILLDFDHFTFAGFYHNCASYGHSQGLHNLVPIWKVYDNEGFSFEYYLEVGEMRIIG